MLTIACPLCEADHTRLLQQRRERGQGLAPQTIGRTFTGCGMQSEVRHRIPPLVRLDLDVGQIPEGAEWPEVMANIVHDPLLDFTLFLGAVGVAGLGGDFQRSEKGKEGLVVADKRVLPFDDRGEHVVSQTRSLGVPPKKRKALSRPRCRVSCRWECVNSI